MLDVRHAMRGSPLTWSERSMLCSEVLLIMTLYEDGTSTTRKSAYLEVPPTWTLREILPLGYMAFKLKPTKGVQAAADPRP